MTGVYPTSYVFILPILLQYNLPFIHYPLPIARYRLSSVQLPTIRCPLSISIIHCTVRTLFSTPRCPMFTSTVHSSIHYPLSTVYRSLFIDHCPLPSVHCPLSLFELNLPFDSEQHTHDYRSSFSCSNSSSRVVDDIVTKPGCLCRHQRQAVHVRASYIPASEHCITWLPIA